MILALSKHSTLALGLSLGANLAACKPTADGTSETGSHSPECQDDLDGDGYLAEECGGFDCDDANGSINPAAIGIVGDGVDQDCSRTETCYVDADGDGYGASATVESSGLGCMDAGETSVPGDCDDASASVSPEAAEACDNGIDDDCDGADESCRYRGTFYLSRTGFKLVGEEAGDYAGLSVAGAGDVNGDSFDDVLVGAPSKLAGTSSDGTGGAAYLVYGPVTASLDLSEAGAKLIGSGATACVGYSVSGAGDVDMDGFGDLLVGNPCDSEGGTDAGAVYLVYGPASGEVDLGGADARIVGECEGDQAGYSVASAGDVNDDGHGDILVGAPYNEGDHPDADADFGAAYLLLGPLEGELDLSTAGLRLTGEYGNDLAGVSVAGAGDVNGDGRGDLLVGAPGSARGPDGGAAYVVYGPLEGDLLLSVADARLYGNAENNHAGLSVASAGDANGDGYADVLIGACQYESPAFDEGVAYLVYGPPRDIVYLTGEEGQVANADATFTVDGADDEAGASVASPGDVDGDGNDDLLVGVSHGSGSVTSAGSAFLFYGPVSGLLNRSDIGAKFAGETAGDKAGFSVSSAGDLDNNGHADLIIGAYASDDGGADAGVSYVIPFAEKP